MLHPMHLPSTLRRLSLLPIVLVLSTIALFAEKPQELRPTSYVNDFAGVLDEETHAKLDALCLEVQQKTKAQIAVVTIKTLEEQPVEDFAVTLFKQWGIGQKGTDRGVLVLLATQDHKYRVEVGYGLESILPDGKVGGFGREMVPQLRQNDYNTALTLITTRIAQTIAADANVEITGMPEIPQRGSRQQPQLTLGQKILFSIIALVVLFILITHPSLLFWMLFSGGGGGGGGGFGGGGGGGFGGFGGGSSGGGGASGSW